MPDDPADMAAQAERCRRLAAGCDDARTKAGLLTLAEEYDGRGEKAAALLSDDRAPM